MEMIVGIGILKLKYLSKCQQNRYNKYSVTNSYNAGGSLHNFG